MKKSFSFLCSIGIMIFCSVSAVALPDKSGAMKRSKDFEIYRIVETAYRKYVAELTEFQTQYTATKRFVEAKRIQEEIQKNIGYVRQIGKSYQFIFSSQTVLPQEVNPLREKRIFAVKDAVRKILNSYVAKLKTEQSVYLKSRDLPRAKAVQEEIQRMTNELKRLEGMGKAFVKKIPGDAKSFRDHKYKCFVLDKGTSWHEAKLRCEELGGYLTKIDVLKELEFVVSITPKNTIPFVGATDEIIKGNWFWTNGQKIQETLRNKIRQVDEKPGRNYLGVGGGKLISKRNYAKEFICEWE